MFDDCEGDPSGSVDVFFVIDTGDNYEVIKYPNYSVSFGGKSEQEEIDRWDALKVSFSAKFNNNCIEPIIL